MTSANLRTQIADAVAMAPSVHDTRPWRLEYGPEGVDLHERVDAAVPRQDPGGRDRLISCGAAAANLELAVRHTGMRTALRLLPDDDRPGLLARIDVLGPGNPSERDDALHAAIFRRHSYRHPFGPGRIDLDVCERLIHPVSHEVPDVQLKPLSGDVAARTLAHLMSYAGSLLRADGAYQRELAAWSGHLDGGLPAPRPECDSLPWGMMRATTHLPDEPTLTERLQAGTLLLVLTVDDARLDHLRAGVAAEHAWLSAVDAGLVASVHTQALQLPEVRAGLIERLELAGYPQLILRLGHPASDREPSHG